MSINYLALGDSYTIGTSIKFHDAFPNQLAERLEVLSGSIIDVQVIARNAWRTDDLIRGIKRTDKKDDYDLVSILIGVNNQYQDLPMEDYLNDFDKIIDIALNLVTSNDMSRIIVISIPNYGCTPYGKDKKDEITEGIHKYNRATKEYCVDREISFFDVTRISEEAEGDMDLIAKDDLHPSKEHYTLWVDSMLEKVAEKLKL